MKPERIPHKAIPAYTDEQVLEALRRSDDSGQLILKWFFTMARDYALEYLGRQFPGLGTMEWDVVFANTHLRLLTRARKGLSLADGTRLTTYYTGVAKFAALDYVQEAREKSVDVGEVQADRVAPSVETAMDRQEVSMAINDWLYKVVDHEEQVKVLLLQAQGYSFREIAGLTGYESEGACRNAAMKGRKKVVQRLLDRPEEKMFFKKLLE